MSRCRFCVQSTSRLSPWRAPVAPKSGWFLPQLDAGGIPKLEVAPRNPGPPIRIRRNDPDERIYFFARNPIFWDAHGVGSTRTMHTRKMPSHNFFARAASKARNGCDFCKGGCLDRKVWPFSNPVPALSRRQGLPKPWDRIFFLHASSELRQFFSH